MISQKDIPYLPIESKDYKKGCGNGLFIVVKKKYTGSDGKEYGGNKYFKGRYQDSEIQVGVFGNQYGQLSLEEARNEWNQIKIWSKDTGQKVSQYKNHQKKQIDETQKTLGDAVYGFLKDKQSEIVSF